MKKKNRTLKAFIFISIVAVFALILYFVEAKLNPANNTADEYPHDVITCTELGLVRGDIDQGKANTMLLLEAFRDGKNVLIDGQYYVKYADTMLSDATISLKGVTSDAELKLAGSATIFNIDDNVDIYIDKIKFTQTGTENNYLFRFSSDCLSHKVVIQNSTFVGNIRCIWFAGSTTLNPLVTPFGIIELFFTNNTVSDNRAVFMQIPNMPSDSIVVDNNLINNFDYVFIYNGIDSEISHVADMYKAKKHMIVRDNTVKCDADWWGDPNNDSYYCFVFFEGTDCTYRGNSIEGMKYYSEVGSGAALYDSFLSCDKLNYIDNTWTNNLSFNRAKEDNTLLKSKSGPPNVNVSRYYENNRYTVEKSYIEMCSAQLAKNAGANPESRLNRDMSASWVQFISLTTSCSEYMVFNNTFNIFDLRLNQSSIPVKEMNIEGNVFSCDKISGSLLHYGLYPTVDYSKNTHIIRNNSIDSKESTPSNDYLIIVRADRSGEARKYGTILIEDNNVTAPCSAMQKDISAREVVVTGNTINLADPGVSDPISINSAIDNLIVTDNKII